VSCGSERDWQIDFPLGDQFLLDGNGFGPNRAFESMDEYYKFTRAYSASYFRGRIAGSDEDDAEITLCFGVGPFDYEVRRGLFEPEELRALTITNRDAREPVTTTEEMPRGERHQLYTKSLVRHTELASFEEFVFLQHFVFTFDEQRKTLFWNPRIMERVLYRAFGLNPNMAKQADTIRRETQHETLVSETTSGKRPECANVSMRFVRNHTLPQERKYLDRITIDRITIDRITIDLITIDRITIDRITIDRITMTESQ